MANENCEERERLLKEKTLVVADLQNSLSEEIKRIERRWDQLKNEKTNLISEGKQLETLENELENKSQFLNEKETWFEKIQWFMIIFNIKSLIKI